MKISSIIWLTANIIALILSIVWFYKEGSIEPIIVGCLALASCGVQFFSKNNESGKMTIKSGKNSKNYQSAGDINIKNEQ